MNEEIEFILDTTKEAMNNAIEHLEKELRTIRAGKATPSMLSNVMVDYYGSQTPLGQVANVNTPDARTLSIQPWEKSMLQAIEKGIQLANLGLNPMNNGDLIMINVPPLTEERRLGLAKQAKAEAEHAKVGIRNARKDANKPVIMAIINSTKKRFLKITPAALVQKFIYKKILCKYNQIALEF